MNNMPDKTDKVEDPSPSNFWIQALVAAIVLVIIGIVVLIIGRVLVGGIIALLGAVFGIGSQVSRNSRLKL
jgi:hypothetical protein